MSYQAKRELLAQVAPRYHQVSHTQRSIILNEFVAATGYARKYAIRLLTSPAPVVRPITRTRAPRYGPDVQAGLIVAWNAANRICAKRLVPFLPTLVPSLERHGHLVVSDLVREHLLALSPATADRLLRSERTRLNGTLSTTKPGSLLKHQVAVRTFADWDELQPGFVEADLVAHCGGVASGSYLQTLTLTDVATGWTECLPLLHHTQAAVIEALTSVRRLLPFPLLGLDTDNGSEFLNAELIAYCKQEAITFTRGRTARTNDQCFVEQKNGAIVRHLVGYDRLEGEAAYRQLVELYRAVRLYVNFFQPSVKLQTKERTGGRVRRRYDAAQTPYQRLLLTDACSPETRTRLATLFAALDPVRLLRQIEILQDAVWRHVTYPRLPSPPSPTATAVMMTSFDINTVQGAATGASADGAVGSDGESAPSVPPPATGRRAYRRTKRSLGPRTYRTRPDPFADVWPEIEGWLREAPERTATSLFADLQARYSGVYTDGQVRTLQRRVQAWRTTTLVTFTERWLAEDEQLAGIGPTLRAIPLTPLDEAAAPTDPHAGTSPHRARRTRSSVISREATPNVR